MCKQFIPAIAHFVVGLFILLNKLLPENSENEQVHFFQLCWPRLGGGGGGGLELGSQRIVFILIYKREILFPFSDSSSSIFPLAS